MKSILKEQKGYTIIIALLLIVLFLGASAVFLQSSLSHAKQEQTVDRNNLAVVAAEMGSERYTKQTKIHLNKTYAELLAKAKAEKEVIITEGKAFKTSASYTGCPGVKSPQELMDCRFNDLEKRLAADLQQSVDSFLANLNRTSVKVDTDVSYSLMTYKLQNTISPNQEVKLLLEVTGKKGDTGSKLLRSDLTFFNPFILDRKTSTDIEVIIDTELKTVSNFFPQVAEKQLPKCPITPIRNMAPCEFDGILSATYLANVRAAGVTQEFYIRTNNIEGGAQLNGLNTYNIPLYLTGNAISNTPNMNGARNLYFYKQGVLQVNQFNNAENNFIVAESINFGNNQNIINNTIILTGSDTKALFRPSSITINNGSKMCINTDGIKLENMTSFNDINGNGSNLRVTGTGLIYLYSETPRNRPDTANIKYLTNADEFMRACGIRISYIPDDPIKYQVPGLTALEGMDMEWEVNYTP